MAVGLMRSGLAARVLGVPAFTFHAVRAGIRGYPAPFAAGSNEGRRSAIGRHEPRLGNRFAFYELTGSHPRPGSGEPRLVLCRAALSNRSSYGGDLRWTELDRRCFSTRQMAAKPWR